MTAPDPAAASMIRILQREGWTVLRTKSYLDAQRRLDRATQRAAAETRAAEHARRWAGEAFTEQRRLADRLTHVYAVARAHGATIEELQQP